jgi:hypothetical protein
MRFRWDNPCRKLRSRAACLQAVEIRDFDMLENIMFTTPPRTHHAIHRQNMSVHRFKMHVRSRCQSITSAGSVVAEKQLKKTVALPRFWAFLLFLGHFSHKSWQGAPENMPPDTIRPWRIGWRWDFCSADASFGDTCQKPKFADNSKSRGKTFFRARGARIRVWGVQIWCFRE